jgi:hypothetical protein
MLVRLLRPLVWSASAPVGRAAVMRQQTLKAYVAVAGPSARLMSLPALVGVWDRAFLGAKATTPAAAVRPAPAPDPTATPITSMSTEADVVPRKRSRVVEDDDEAQGDERQVAGPAVAMAEDASTADQWPPGKPYVLHKGRRRWSCTEQEQGGRATESPLRPWYTAWNRSSLSAAGASQARDVLRGGPFGLTRTVWFSLRITDILSDLFRRIIAWTPADLRHAVYLCTNRVRSPGVGLPAHARTCRLGPPLPVRTHTHTHTCPSWVRRTRA